MKNKKPYSVKVESREEYFITIPDEIMEEKGWGEETKFSLEEREDGSILLSPYVDIQIDMNDELFMELSKLAHERDITFNQLCNDILKEQLGILEKEESKTKGWSKASDELYTELEKHGIDPYDGGLDDI